MSVNPKNLHVDFVLPSFNLCLFENEADEEAELLSQLRRGFQSMIENLLYTVQVTVKKTRMELQRSTHFAKETQAIPLTMK